MVCSLLPLFVPHVHQPWQSVTQGRSVHFLGRLLAIVEWHDQDIREQGATDTPGGSYRHIVLEAGSRQEGRQRMA